MDALRRQRRELLGDPGRDEPHVSTDGDDVGGTLRFQVTGSNPSATLVRSSSPTAVVQSGPTVAQMGDTSTGFSSVFVRSADELGSMVTASAAGTTTDFEFFARGAGGTQIFTPVVYSVVNGQPGSVLATGAPVTVSKGTDGRWYVSALASVHLSAGTQYALALDPSGVGSTYVGAENATTGPMSFFVDYG